MTKKFRVYCIKSAVTFGIMAICVGMIFTVKGCQHHQRNKLLEPQSSRVRGLADAPIQVIEYIDFRCGPCAHASRFMKGFWLQHPQDIRLEVRFFPIHTGHDLLSFRYAECAGRQQKFWAFHDRLMGRQKEWIRLHNPEEFFLKIAEQLDLDQNTLQACLDDPAVKQQIRADKKSGERLGVKATPTYFINGEMAVGGRNLRNTIRETLNAVKGQ